MKNFSKESIYNMSCVRLFGLSAPCRAVVDSRPTAGPRKAAPWRLAVALGTGRRLASSKYRGMSPCE